MRLQMPSKGRPPLAEFSVEMGSLLIMAWSPAPEDRVSGSRRRRRADFLVAEGVVDDISHEGPTSLLREEGVSFQRLKTWKQSNDLGGVTKKNRILELYDISRLRAKASSPAPAGQLPEAPWGAPPAGRL